MATVLKSGDRDKQRAAAQKVSAVAGFNLSDLADEGRTRLEQCRLQVQEMLAQAEREVAGIQKAAQERGYDEGLKQAAIDADKKLQEKAEQQASHSTSVMQEAVRKIRDAHAEWMKDYEDILIKMSLAAVEKIIRRRLEGELIDGQWAEEALLSTRMAVSLTLVIHPETLAKAGEDSKRWS